MATAKTEKQNDMLHQNMRFYGLVQDTPKDAQKAFNNGRFSGTDINPMWRIKKLTEVFGPSGFGWWTQNVKYEFVEADITPKIDGKLGPETKEVAVFCELELIVRDPETKEVSQPIYGVGGNTFVAQRKVGPQASDEAKKMAYTDALSIACKALGFSHDIYYQNDRTKYSTPADIPVKETKAASKDTAPASTSAPAFGLTEVIKELDIKVKALTESMDDKQKDALAAKIKKACGVVNYRKCTDVVALNSLLAELQAA